MSGQNINQNGTTEKKAVIYLTIDDVVNLIIEWAESGVRLPEWLQKMMDDIQARDFMNEPVSEEEYISFITAFAYNMPNDSPLKEVVLRFLRNYNSDWVICEDF
jgi:hypothetical protein